MPCMIYFTSALIHPHGPKYISLRAASRVMGYIHSTLVTQETEKRADIHFHKFISVVPQVGHDACPGWNIYHLLLV